MGTIPYLVRVMAQSEVMTIHVDLYVRAKELNLVRVLSLETTPQFPVVVVAPNELDIAVELFDDFAYFVEASVAKHREISQTVHSIFRAYSSVPLANHDFVHVTFVLEWALAILDNISVAEVRLRIRSEEHCGSSSLITHNVFLGCIHL